MRDNGGQRLSQCILPLLSLCRKPSILVVEKEILIEILLFSDTSAKQEQLFAGQSGETKVQIPQIMGENTQKLKVILGPSKL